MAYDDCNKAGSGETPQSTDTPEREDAQRAVNNANRASDLHRKVNDMAERGNRR